MPQDPETPRFSRTAEELIGDLRGIAFDEPRRQVKRPTKPVSDIIEALASKYGIGQSTPEQSLRDRWPELVTPVLARYSHVAEINKSGWLVILVANSVAKQELSNNRRLFLRNIKGVPGCAHIKGLSFRAGG